ncbi:MAG TPA: ABC transporter ATP-binding protein [Chloroflexota bacterium]|nr:ABC transporter ATP-binding protein [Chloroflexota bacterium]HZU05902.1 ABC transporter ATP-binding protein [Chloroflexota bacterium]
MQAATTPAVASALAPGALPRIALRNVTKSFPTPDGGRYQALGGVSFDVAPGEFVSVVGPSGCGKSTLLRLVAGLDRPDEGEIRRDGQPVGGIDRRLGFVFQQDALLPWRTVYENVALGLRIRRLPPAEVRERAREWIARVGLRGFEDYYPARLSGGMRKRVAIAQTLCYEPDVILMDEPFAHLDVQTRYYVEEDLMRLCIDGQRTILFVTHDLDEAIGLADRVVVLSAGPRSRVRAEEAVPLPRPRNLLAVRAQPGFTALATRLWQLLFEEVSRVYGRGTG